LYEEDCKKNTTCYLLKKSHCMVQSKRFITKVMFLTIVAYSQLSETKEVHFYGRIETFSFVAREHVQMNNLWRPN